MKNNKKRIISILVVTLMLAAMLPAGVFALDEAAPAPEAPAPAAEEAAAPAPEAPAEEAPAAEAAEEAAGEAEAPAEEAEDEADEAEEKEAEAEETDSSEDASVTVTEDEGTEEAGEADAAVTVVEEEGSEEAEVTVVEEEGSEEAEVTVTEKDGSAEVTVTEGTDTTEAPAEEPVEEEPAAPAVDFDEIEGLCKGIAKAGAIIRTAPVWNAEEIKQITEDVRIKVLEYTSEEWYNVVLDDAECTEGYVYSLQVALEDEEQEEPVVVTVIEDEKTEENDVTVTEDAGTEEVTVTEDDNTEEVTVTEEAGSEEITATEEDSSAEADVPAAEDEELTEIEDYETPLGLEELEEEEVFEVLYIAAAKANAALRTSPDGMSPIIMNLEEGAELQIILEQGDWYAVLLGEETLGYKVAYIYKDDIASEEEEPEDPEVKPDTPKKVTIFTSRKVVMEEGETVTLTSKLEGFEGLELMYIWKVNKGEGFEEVPGANEPTYSFEASAETLSWGWLLTVLYR